MQIVTLGEYQPILAIETKNLINNILPKIRAKTWLPLSSSFLIAGIDVESLKRIARKYSPLGSVQYKSL